MGKSSDKMAPASVKDVDQQKFVVALSAFLKKSGKVKIPEWADIVKTSVAKELAPYDEGWYYTRCASVARHIYVRSPVGVKTITKIYVSGATMGPLPAIGAVDPAPWPARFFSPWRPSSW